jgi:hypothetical protein
MRHLGRFGIVLLLLFSASLDIQLNWLDEYAGPVQ